MKMYQVGGAVRDELLGTPSKDIDFSVVLEDFDLFFNDDPFSQMEVLMEGQGFKLIPEARKPEYFTARGFFPKDHPTYPGKPADFVLARKEGSYSDGRRPDEVMIGTLEDDLSRRDFTMNAIAKNGDFEGVPLYINPFGGIQDIEKKIIRAVGDPMERMKEDALRAVRALRFSVTKGFTIDSDLRYAMNMQVTLNSIRNKISDERIQQELSKMFRFDTMKSLQMLNSFPQLTEAMFAGTVSLDSTMKTKGRG